HPTSASIPTQHPHPSPTRRSSDLKPTSAPDPAEAATTSAPAPTPAPATTAPATTHPPDAPATSPSAARQLGQSEDDCEDEPEQYGSAREPDVALHSTSAGRRRIQGHAELLCECLRDQVYSVRQPGPVF